MKDQQELAKFLSSILDKFDTEDIETAFVVSILGGQKVVNTEIKNLASRKNKKIESLLEFLNSNKVSCDLDTLLKFYELQISSSDRKTDGAYFTPSSIVDFITNNVVEKKGTVCDPACGSGSFLLASARRLKKLTNLSYKKIFSDLLFGVDISESNIFNSKKILSLLAIADGEDARSFSFNLYTSDSLTFEWESILPKGGFNYVIGNPPYVRTKNLRVDTKENIKKWSVGSIGNVDLYIPFFEIGINILNDEGKVGYITPSTYFTALNARDLRTYLHRNNYVEKIVDFNGWQVFYGATTYTAITFLSRNNSSGLQYGLVKDPTLIEKPELIKTEKVSRKLLAEDNWRLLPKADSENIFKIENAGSPLFEYVDRYITGLATLQNDIYLLKDNGGKFLIKEFEGKEYKIERGITQKIIKPNKIKTPLALKENRERIIFPYIIKNGSYSLVGESELSKKYPNAYKYLKAVRPILEKRDKGERQYKEWYAFGRTQGLNAFGKKIIMPMMNDKPAFVRVEDEDTLFYCGYALYPKQEEDLLLLEKVLNSNVLWYYIKKTSKNYSGGYKSFAKNYVKNFSIPHFNREEKEFLLSSDREKIDEFLWEKYQLC